MIQNCHSEVLRGIPLNLTIRYNDYFSLRSCGDAQDKPLRLCGSSPSEVRYA
jgi:hypothetical protein